MLNRVNRSRWEDGNSLVNISESDLRIQESYEFNVFRIFYSQPHVLSTKYSPV